MEKIRLDKYLWAIRIFKTRTQAASAIDSGKVKLYGEAVKPSRAVIVGDLYDIRTDARKWTIQVKDLLENRVQYNDAIKHYVDLTPPEVAIKKTSAFVENTGKRQSKQGRPTKKNRRELNSLLG